jgi:ParB/RepB/Spo0J family partition protein
MKTMAKRMAAATKKSAPLDDRPTQGKADVKSSATRVMKVRIEDVEIPKKWRSINKGALRDLADSMAEIGLQQPISVRPRNNSIRLVAGRHRLEAARSLGWSHIDAFVTKGSKLGRKLWQHSENLHRAELSVLERAEAVDQWARTVDEKRACGHQPHDKGISRAAKTIGTSRDDVRRSRLIAGISSEAKRAAVKAGLSDNQVALLKIAKEPPKAQVRKVGDIAKRTQAPKPELSDREQKQFRRLQETLAGASELLLAWKRASQTVRDRFIAQLRKIKSSSA